MTPPAGDRYHAFDALRAAMMLLGIVLHAAVAYMTSPQQSNIWPVSDSERSPIADLLVLGIHVFRMPVFFVMAGFFTALLVERRGMRGMLRNRFLRVTLPFLVFWVILVPLNFAAIEFARAQISGGDGIAALRAWTGPYWADDTKHLWFLWFLTLFYVIAWILSAGAAAVSPGLRAALTAVFMRVMSHPARILVLAIPTALLLWAQGGMIYTATTFEPHMFVLAGYGMFFAFGWALWYHQSLLSNLTRFAWTKVFFAVALTLVHVPALIQFKSGTATIAIQALASVTGALMVWLLIFGIMGLALRWARHERPWVRYLTDASYWMYLVHLPLVLIASGVLGPLQIPAVAKIALIVVMVTPILLLSYHWFVRRTAIGVFLNGRRYPAPGNASIPRNVSGSTKEPL